MAVLIKVSKNDYGIRVRLGKRLPGPLFEGPHVKWPDWIEVVELISMELASMEFEVEFLASDPTEADKKLEVIVKGSLQFVPDPYKTLQYGPNRGADIFISLSEETIRSGIEERIEGVLGVIGGQCPAEAFVEKRQAVQDLLNAVLRTRIPPHEDHDNLACGVRGCTLPGVVPPGKVLDFYTTHKATVEPEDEDVTHHSSTEWRYGIRIRSFEIGSVSFTDETLEAFEDVEQAKLRQPLLTMVVTAATTLQGLNVSPDTALNTAQQILLGDRAPRTVFAVEGGGGGLTTAGLLSGVAATNSPTPTPLKKH